MQNLLVIFADSDSGSGILSGIGGFCCFAIYLVLVIGAIAGLWTTFAKAGKPGWAAIVPIYNIVVMLEIVGKPLWWIVFFIVPCLNFAGPIVGILIAIEMAKAFGKDLLYGLGLAFLPFIFYPMLGFGSAQYVGPSQPIND